MEEALFNSSCLGKGMMWIGGELNEKLGDAMGTQTHNLVEETDIQINK